MFELKILFYNVLIFCILIAGMYVYLKWQKKKRIEKMLNKMEASYLKYAPPNANELLKKRQAEYARKYPLKALKRKIISKIEWLFWINNNSQSSKNTQI